MNTKIVIELNKNQAIVLFELITELSKKITHKSAEQSVLMEIECLLEKQLTAPFKPNYKEIVARAKDAILASTENYFKKEWLIELLKKQKPKSTDLILQLEEMNETQWIKQPYIRFVNGKNANQKGAQWQFKENIVLEHKTQGTIVLDILKDGSIGGFELLNELD